MSSKPANVEEYLARLDPDRRHILESLRRLVRRAAPQASETMRYGMPTYELNGHVAAFASQKHYVSLYLDTDLVAEHKAEFGHLNCGKSCIRFNRLDQLPLEVVETMLVNTIEKRVQGD
jgi:uncharacterized protein YdhG (YjbR/CyaY superfamily)